MKALVGAFNQEKALVGTFFVIVQLFVEPMDRFTALVTILVMEVYNNFIELCNGLANKIKVVSVLHEGTM